MPKKRSEVHIIWPEYFNSEIPRNKGRRLPNSLCVASPTAQDLFNVAKKLGLHPTLEADRSHPSRWYRSSGRITVPIDQTKTETLKSIAQSLVIYKR